jgi:hypothetical protein
MAIFNSYVKLPEGNYNFQQDLWGATVVAQYILCRLRALQSRTADLIEEKRPSQILLI